MGTGDALGVSTGKAEVAHHLPIGEADEVGDQHHRAAGQIVSKSLRKPKNGGCSTAAVPSVFKDCSEGGTRTRDTTIRFR
jgi:hypothetical protein